MRAIPEDIGRFLEQYFEKIFVVTVPRFTERHQQVKERLAGLPFEFFYGVDKQELTDDFIQANYRYDKKNTVTVNLYSKPLNAGEVACSLSHRKLYRSIIDNNWERVLIFEDDVVPDYANLSLLPRMIDDLPPDWELLYLGYLKNEDPGYRTRLKHSWYRLQSRLGWSKLPNSMVKNLLPKNLNHNLMKAGYHDCTHAYALTPGAAKKLLSLQTPVQYRADNAISHLVLARSLRAFAAKPPLFHQEVFIDKSSKSYIR